MEIKRDENDYVYPYECGYVLNVCKELGDWRFILFGWDEKCVQKISLSCNGFKSKDEAKDAGLKFGRLSVDVFYKEDN